MLKFGFAGTLALGLFVLVNGIVRNGILVSSGQSAAGIFSLVSDLFFAPMTLFGTAYSLSKMRSMYQLQSAPLEFRL